MVSQASDMSHDSKAVAVYESWNKKAVLLQGNRAMKQLLFWFKVRRQHSLQV